VRSIEDHKVNPANDQLAIMVMDDPGPGGASHHYRVVGPSDECPIVWDLHFQKGPIGEVGVKGLTHEVLLAIIVC
jgi:hypothetical protein